MARYLGWLVLAAVFILPAVSAVLGWLPSRADLAWLIMVSFTTITGALWFYLSPRLDRTDDPLISGIIYLSLLMSLVVATVLMPSVVFITGIDWLIATLSGLAIVLCAEVMSALKLRFW